MRANPVQAGVSRLRFAETVLDDFMLSTGAKLKIVCLNARSLL